MLVSVSDARDVVTTVHRNVSVLQKRVHALLLINLSSDARSGVCGCRRGSLISHYRPKSLLAKEVSPSIPLLV